MRTSRAILCPTMEVPRASRRAGRCHVGSREDPLTQLRVDRILVDVAYERPSIGVGLHRLRPVTRANQASVASSPSIEPPPVHAFEVLHRLPESALQGSRRAGGSDSARGRTRWVRAAPRARPSRKRARNPRASSSSLEQRPLPDASVHQVVPGTRFVVSLGMSHVACLSWAAVSTSTREGVRRSRIGTGNLDRRCQTPGGRSGSRVSDTSCPLRGRRGGAPGTGGVATI